MKLRFWGVRGSTPTPYPGHLRYGGNTSCVEVRTDNGDIFIFDGGTGLRSLGKKLMQEYGHRSIHAFIFLSHYHWDHIQGIPFFEPLYNPENHFFFHSFPSHRETVQEALEEQMSDPYFPVNMEAMAAHRRFFNLSNEQITFDGGTTLCTARLNHPQGCLGYRLTSGGHSFVYATDNEPGDPEGDRNIRRLAEGADVLVVDAQYTPFEYVNYRKGWGHSTWREAVNVARDAGVKSLILYHHDPDHHDTFVDSIVTEAARHFPEVSGAFEGMQVDLKDGSVEMNTVSGVERRLGSRHETHLPAVVEGRTRKGLSFVEHTVLENLSLGGAFFQLANDPDPSADLNVHIKLNPEPSGPAKVLEVPSQAVRAEKHNGTTGIAVAFRTGKPSK